MSKHHRALRTQLAAALLSPALALAWTPYGYGPGTGPSEPWQGAPAAGEGTAPPAAPSPYPDMTPPSPPDFGFGGPGFGPYGPGAGGPGHGGPGYSGSGYGEPGYPPFGPPPGFGGPGYGGPGAAGPIGITQQATEDAYILEIPLDGRKPEDIQVSVQGRWIGVSRGQSAQQTREETFDQGRGYMRSFSYSSGSGLRRFTLPRDADAQAMEREDGEDSVRILIPRRRD